MKVYFVFVQKNSEQNIERTTETNFYKILSNKAIFIFVISSKITCSIT